METKQVVTGRYGDPSCFLFKGQCYDAGHSSNSKPCAICGRGIRFCFVLKAEDPRRPVPSKITIGRCCFHYFKEWNIKLYKALEIAYQWLMTTVDGQTIDVKQTKTEVQVKTGLRQWREVKRAALARVRRYHEQTGKEWLPEDLFILKVEAEKQPPAYKRPTSAARFYEQQIQKLKEILG